MIPENPSRKPRLRRTAPTVRQKVEMAQSAAVAKPSRIRQAVGRAKAPLKKIRLPQNKYVKAVVKPIIFIGKILKRLVPSYFINSWNEVRQVTWPGRRETWRLTGTVFVFAIIFGSLIAVVDKGLNAIFKNVILK